MLRLHGNARVSIGLRHSDGLPASSYGSGPHGFFSAESDTGRPRTSGLNARQTCPLGPRPRYGRVARPLRRAFKRRACQRRPWNRMMRRERFTASMQNQRAAARTKDTIAVRRPLPAIIRVIFPSSRRRKAQVRAAYSVSQSWNDSCFGTRAGKTDLHHASSAVTGVVAQARRRAAATAPVSSGGPRDRSGRALSHSSAAPYRSASGKEPMRPLP